MKRIFSLSYNEDLLRARELMLEAAGYQITSALGYHEPMEICAASVFDIAIVDHSIPKKDKLALIEPFRKFSPRFSPGAPIIDLTRSTDEPLREVDYYIEPPEPRELVRFVSWVLNPASDPRPPGLRHINKVGL